jgi:hypothetical protein
MVAAMIRGGALALVLAAGVARAALPWELPPLRYAETAATDTLAKMVERAAGAEWLEGATPLEKLRSLLQALEIPVESQVMVFSKTSAQNPLIHPRNPRALYFNDHAYVGYIPGGDFEVIIQDPVLGMVFYMIEGGGPERVSVLKRDRGSCMDCHATTRTESVPGVLVRSVHPAADGHLLLALGTSHIDHSSPLEERWGGYYVTGRSSLIHFGNQTFDMSQGRDFPRVKVELGSVAERVPGLAQRYPRDTSDIVALMVLEHQCRVHNLLNAATVEYRRAHYLAKSIDPEADPDEGSAGRYAVSSAHKLAEVLLFKDEASLGEDGIEGDTAFQKAFVARYPKSADGRSLADFQLHSRIFKHQCSYMIYSSSFAALPPAVKRPLVARLRELLGENETTAADWIKPVERKKIGQILAETLPVWNEIDGSPATPDGDEGR